MRGSGWKQIHLLAAIVVVLPVTALAFNGRVENPVGSGDPGPEGAPAWRPAPQLLHEGFEVARAAGVRDRVEDPVQTTKNDGLPHPAGDYTISDNVDLVLLDAAVKDPKGGYVTGLDKSAFEVYEDGHRRTITQFASVDTPVTVGLVVDDSGSMRNKRPYVIMAGLSFAKQSNPKDEFFVVNFNDRIGLGLPPQVPFTDNLQELRSALYFGQPQGQTALYDAVAYAIKHLESGHRDKRTLIVVSDGRDNSSKLNFSELVRIIEASRATIYTVGLYDPDDYEVNRHVLRKIAHISGGEFFEPEELAQVLPVFNKISKDIRNRYTIGYVPDEENDKRRVRTVKVAAQQNGRKLDVRTRASYSITPLSQVLAKIPAPEGAEAR